MKTDNWRHLERMLERYGFFPDSSPSCVDGARWFVCANPGDDAITTSLRFVFKPKMHVLTAHLGWRHSVAHEFCLAALEEDWPRGFAWLKDAGVIDAPCLSVFNLADHMGWRLRGMPVGSAPAVYESAEVRLGEVLEQSRWAQQDSAGLLARYTEDRAPFSWQAGNSAIRLAQIAGLIQYLNVDTAHFDSCASDHAAAIETDMFGMGQASSWIVALRSRLTRESGSC